MTLRGMQTKEIWALNVQATSFTVIFFAHLRWGAQWDITLWTVEPWIRWCAEYNLVCVPLPPRAITGESVRSCSGCPRSDRSSAARHNILPCSVPTKRAGPEK
eukprot:Hpha_TRINITY_DN5051_c0_g1::TRINITY_DN5051_c0_g1_i2::g.94019::m.94019